MLQLFVLLPAVQTWGEYVRQLQSVVNTTCMTNGVPCANFSSVSTCSLSSIDKWTFHSIDDTIIKKSCINLEDIKLFTVQHIILLFDLIMQ